MTAAITRTRTLREIATEIITVWKRPYFGAVPYIQAMTQLTTVTDSIGQDDADDIVLYFLSNARSWRGEDAKRIKAELKAMVGI